MAGKPWEMLFKVSYVKLKAPLWSVSLNLLYVVRYHGTLGRYSSPIREARERV